MKRIFKYPLEITDEQHVEMPFGASLLTAQFQGDDLVVWALVDAEEQETKKKRFRIYGTGHPIEGLPGSYLATAQEPMRGLVWHVFAT